MVKTAVNGTPTAVVSNGREWAIVAETVRWFERVRWWEARRRMPLGLSRVDVEILQVQVRLGSNGNSALTTMLLERDGLGGSWRLRESVAVPPDCREAVRGRCGVRPTGSVRALENPPPRLLGDAAVEGLR
ncbi:MAG TPA: hypothetical protein VIM08_19350 [Arthrobacter sp.]